MICAYARVSTREQTIDSQLTDLKRTNYDVLYEEKKSGKNSKDRPVFNEMMKTLRAGDTLVVYDLTRLGRSIRDLVNIMTELNERKINFISVKNNFDTTTPSGRLQYNIFAAIAEYDREMIVERTEAGLAAAREQGRIGGRPKGLSKENELIAKQALKMKKEGVKPVDIITVLKLTKPTYYRYVQYAEQIS